MYQLRCVLTSFFVWETVFVLLHENPWMFSHRFGSREPHVLQLQPLQSPLPSATQVPQVSAAGQRGEQSEESPGGPAAAGTRGKEEERVKVTLRHQGSNHVFVLPCCFLSHWHSNPHMLVLSVLYHVTYHIKLHLHNMVNILTLTWITNCLRLPFLWKWLCCCMTRQKKHDAAPSTVFMCHSIEMKEHDFNCGEP